MAVLMPEGKQSFEDSAGAPLVGGKVFTYDAGTTNPRPTYTTSAGISQNTNPVILDGRGEATIFWQGAYKVVLTDAAGVTIWTVDNIVSTDTASDAAISALKAQLADFSNPANGSAMIGDSDAGNFFAGTNQQAINQEIGLALYQQPVNVFRFLSSTQRAQVLAGGTTIDLTTAINTAKTAAGNRPLYFPAGTYSITSLDFKLITGGIVGDGIGNTFISIRSAVARALDFNDVTDQNNPPRAGILKGFTLEGNGVALGIGIDIRYRHQFVMQDLYVRGFTGAGGVGIKQKDSYLCVKINVRTAANGTGDWFVGSNHASTNICCISDTNTVCNLLVQTNGTIPDGNKALSFDTCTYQTGPAVAGGNIDISCDTADLKTCYVGENNGAGCAAILCRVGLVTLRGGDIFYGNTSTSWGITPLGGKVWIEHSNINGQTSSGISVMIGGGNGGTVAWSNSKFNGIVSGTPVWTGDVVDYGPQGTVYAERLGKNWTGEGNNITFSSAVSGNKQTWTVLTAPGPSPLLGAQCALTNMSKWRDGENLFILFVYESSKAVTVRTSNGAFGAAVLTLASALPATGASPTGTPNTAPSFGVIATSTAATLVEAIQASSAVSDFLAIYEFDLEDSRKLNKGGGQVGNMSKG